MTTFPSFLAASYTASQFSSEGITVTAFCRSAAARSFDPFEKSEKDSRHIASTQNNFLSITNPPVKYLTCSFLICQILFHFKVKIEYLFHFWLCDRSLDIVY